MGCDRGVSSPGERFVSFLRQNQVRVFGGFLRIFGVAMTAQFFPLKRTLTLKSLFSFP